MRNVSDKSCGENHDTYFLSNNISENRAVCDIIWKNMVEPDRPQMTRRMRVACWIAKATDTHLEYVLLIDFPRQHWLRERAC
jgi:hypothetical protein